MMSLCPSPNPRRLPTDIRKSQRCQSHRCIMVRRFRKCCPPATPKNVFPWTPLIAVPFTFRTLPGLPVSKVLCVKASTVSRPTNVSVASCNVQVRKSVALPVSSKLPVAGFAELPAKNKFAIGTEFDPKSHSPATWGTSALAIAGTVNVQEPVVEPVRVTAPDVVDPTALRRPCESTCQPIPFASACQGMLAEPAEEAKCPRMPEPRWRRHPSP